MSQPIRVELAEGGTGLVQEGDPAWNLCRALQKRGFTTIYLPRVTLLSGKPDDLYTVSNFSQDMARVALTQDQMASLDSVGDFPCVHHWVLETPDPEKDHIGAHCKFCGVLKTFPKEGQVDFRLIRNGRMTAELNRLRKAADQDWRARLTDAEQAAGVYRPAA